MENKIWDVIIVGGGPGGYTAALYCGRAALSVLVLEKKAHSVIVTEGNYNSSIHWGREITRSSLESSGFYVTTRYPEG